MKVLVPCDQVTRPDRQGTARWMIRTKPALNAFVVTFAGRFETNYTTEIRRAHTPLIGHSRWLTHS